MSVASREAHALGKPTDPPNQCCALQLSDVPLRLPFSNSDLRCQCCYGRVTAAILTGVTG